MWLFAATITSPPHAKGTKVMCAKWLAMKNIQSSTNVPCVLRVYMKELAKSLSLSVDAFSKISSDIKFT